MARRGPVFQRLQKRFRTRRFAEIERMIRAILEVKDEVTILDAGGRARYWQMLPQDLRPKVRITAVNFGDELSNFDTTESGLQVENVIGDACHMPQYADGSFDLVHSNSVIEHVGSYLNMVRFAEEVRRVGKAYFVQTPFFWFPVDPHYAVPFIHWLPDNLRILVFTSVTVGLGKKYSYLEALEQVDHTRIVDRRLMRNLFPDGRIINERFMLMTKSVTAIRDYPR